MNKKVYTLDEARELYKERMKKYEEAHKALYDYHKGEYYDSLRGLIDSRRAVIRSENDAIDAITREETRVKYNDAKEQRDLLSEIDFACKVKMLAAKTVLLEACRFSVYTALASVIRDYTGKAAGTKTLQKFKQELSEVSDLKIVSVTSDTVVFSACGEIDRLYINGSIIDRNNKYSNSWDVYECDRLPKEYPSTDCDWDEWCAAWLDARNKIYQKVEELENQINEYIDKYSIGFASLPTLKSRCLDDDF